ncbi:MAG TPA: glucosaminidase domain-containing protein [Puia sp.]|nr:glucosaminidase domain-containing protein [Puia sp.]
MKTRLVMLSALGLVCIRVVAQRSADILAYINAYHEIAISEMQRSGIPASITLAQGIHETEAGTSELVKKSNNHFGIKCKETWTGSVVYHDDDERGECFRSYDKAEDSYRDHSDFLRESARYAFLFKLDPMDYHAWAYGLKKAGYATNLRYSQILIKLIEDYGLQQYTLTAMGKMKDQDQVQLASLKSKNESFDNITAKKNSSPPASNHAYPSGEFTINRTNVVFAKSGTSLLAIATQYEVPLSRVLDFNDLENREVLEKDQLVFLQRKRKTGENQFHIVQKGECLYDICQAEGIRLESLLQYNQMGKGMEPAPGEKIYLQTSAPGRPLLASAEQRVYAGVTIHSAIQDKPEPLTHVVQTKETLYSIAKKYGVGVDQLRQWNNLDSASVTTGQELIIYKN